MSNNALKQKPFGEYGVLLILLLAAWGLQSAPSNFLSVFALRPVLVLGLTACVGMIYGELIGGVFGFGAGLLMEIDAAPSVGFHLLVLTALGILCGLAVRHLLMNNIPASFTLLLSVCVLYFTLYWLLYKVILGADGFYYWIRFSLPSAAFTALWGCGFYGVLRLLHHKK